MNTLALPPEIRGHALYKEPMARHTSWRVGGPADVLFQPQDKADLELFIRTMDSEQPLFWLGLGSNLLVRDGGLRAMVIDTHGALNGLHRISQREAWCDAGVPCAKLAKQCARWNIGPAEFFAGIPGTLGGALAMNAGAFGGETWRHVIEVETIDRQGQIHMRPASEYQISYRRVVGPVGEGFLGARLRFEPRDKSLQSGEAEIRALLARRKETQPIGEPSCGSVFTNPPGDHAARLIESAGLKGFRIGGACVSEKHANFFINEGGATAADLEQLIEHVKATVLKVHGVELKPEVRIVGEPCPGTSGSGDAIRDRAGRVVSP